MRKIKVGVIGTGFIGPVHIEALRRLGFVEVLALADISLERARAKADELCIPLAYGDYRELIANPEIEVVHLCTPNNLHYPMAREAILAGKNVVCDKPLAMTSAEGAEVMASGLRRSTASSLRVTSMSAIIRCLHRSRL